MKCIRTRHMKYLTDCVCIFHDNIHCSCLTLYVMLRAKSIGRLLSTLLPELEVLNLKSLAFNITQYSEIKMNKIKHSTESKLY